MQSPSATTRAPASFVRASKASCAGGLTGAIAGFHIGSKATASAATIATPPAASNPDLRVIRIPFMEGLCRIGGALHRAPRQRAMSCLSRARLGSRIGWRVASYAAAERIVDVPGGVAALPARGRRRRGRGAGADAFDQIRIRDIGASERNEVRVAFADQCFGG